jgi:hypothetical protein
MVHSGKDTRGARKAPRWRARLLNTVAAAVVMLPGAARADAILTWNNELRDAIRQTSVPFVNGPPEAAREMAMVDAAMYDAVNAATGLAYRPYAYAGTAVSGASADVAALSAGYQVMISIFSSPLWQKPLPAGNPVAAANVLASINNIYATALASLNLADPVVANGLTLGQTTANAIIAKRSTDGSFDAITAGLVPQTPPGSGKVPGVYVPPSRRPEMFPQWGSVTPFGTTIGAIRGHESELPTVKLINGPGGMSGFIQSAYYANQVLQTECSGAATSLPAATQSACATAGIPPESAAQAKAALFWNDPGGTMLPPGHWLQITDTVMTSSGIHLSELQEARLSALVSIAEADAGIGAWDVKYQENIWRPITAIHDCANWNQLFTTCDPNWRSLIVTPPHPDYVAGHPAFSGAGATVLASFFGTDNIPFCSTSDPYVNGLQGGPVGPLTECFDSFSEASSGVNGAEFSRVAGGIHTPFAVEDALQLGNLIGADDFANNLQLVPEPGSAMLLVSGLLGLRLRRRRMARWIVLA